MNKLLKIGVSFVLVIALILYSFAQFGHALVDYSLESLGVALKATEQSPQSGNVLGKHVYQNVIKGMILDEASQRSLNYENLLLLEAASRSLDQPEELAGIERARFYIGQVQENKQQQDSAWETIKFVFNQFLMRVQHFYTAMVAYVKSRAAPKKEQSFQISDKILLNRAQQKERQGEREEAKNLYKQYLEIYRYRPDRGLVSLSLANILILQKEWRDAKKLLEKIKTEFFNREEGRVALSMIKNISILKEKSDEIDRLQQDLIKKRGSTEEGTILFKLGLGYLALQNLKEAEEYFSKTLDLKPDASLRHKATFYLGWVYKLDETYEKAIQLLENLVKEKDINPQMELALFAQLADIYMQTGDLEKARYYYQRLSEEAKKEELKNVIDAKSWAGLADIEQGVVLVQKGDGRALERVLYGLSTQGFDEASFFMLKQKLRNAKGIDLRTQGFRKLLVGETHDAINLFEKNKTVNPEDAWTYSGIATADFILQDMDRARDIARQAYGLLQDEYTASILAYIHGHRGESQEAIRLYEEALRFKRDYVPAKFNITCEYLKGRDYNSAYAILKELDQEYRYSNNESMKAKILNNLGVALWGMGQRNEAYEHFREALVVNPRFVRAEENMKLIRLGETPDTVTEIGLNRDAA